MAKRRSGHVTPTAAPPKQPNLPAPPTHYPTPNGHAPQPQAPAPASPPPVGGPPVDASYEAYLATARRNRQLADAQALYQTQQIQQSYGLEDHSNPYSRAALLEESYKRSKLATTNQMSNAGQLYSGAYGRAQGENQRNYSIGYDQLARQYADALHGVQYGQAQSYANYGIGVDDQALQALLRQLGVK